MYLCLVFQAKIASNRPQIALLVSKIDSKIYNLLYFYWSVTDPFYSNWLTDSKIILNWLTEAKKPNWRTDWTVADRLDTLKDLIWAPVRTRPQQHILFQRK
jgi:hypothetical protein